MINFKSPLLAVLLMFALHGIASGQTEEEMIQANNPLANMTAFNLQNYYIPNVSEMPDQTLNTFWLRLVQPVGPFLIRASLPMPTVPIGDDMSESGIGDLNIIGTYTFLFDDAMLGIGPQFVFPTANEEVLGTEKWQAGAAILYFNYKSPQIQFGGLLTWQASIGGEEDRKDISAIAAQPFVMFQLGGGTYLRTAPIAVFDLKEGKRTVPFGFGAGKVVKVGDTVFNIFFEPQFDILTKGPGQPRFQLFTALNMQF